MKIKRFISSSGIEILAGLDDESNEAVSLKLAHANDLWFHIKGFSGSHVLLRCGEKGIKPDMKSIEEAAGIAIWFSKMRNAGIVSVNYCHAKQVRKPNRAKPGTVNISKAKSIKTRPCLLDEVPFNEK